MPFTIVRDDLTRMQVDAIVNTANPHPKIGTGTDYAIYKAAGAEKLLKERQKIGDIDRGDAAITGGYSLPAKYIIHTVGPIWINGNASEEDLLRSCYQNSLNLAVKRKCKSIAFPLISTGNYGFPKDLALKIVIEVVQQFLEDHEMMIYLVVFGSDTTRLSETLFSKIEERITDEYAARKATEEYAFPMEYQEEALPPGQYPDFYSEMQMRPHAQQAPAPASSKGNKAPAPGIFSSNKSSSAIRRSLKSLLAQKDETFSQMLLRLIKEKGMTNAQVYKKANQSKQNFSKIKNDKDYQPQKKTAMAYALALELNLDESKDLLARAGYTFSPSNDFDRVIEYCIETREYNIIEIEIILYDLGLETLCNF